MNSTVKSAILIFSVLILKTVFCFSTERDSTNGSIKVLIRADYGFIIAHRPSLEPLQEEHLKGFEISFVRPTYGKNPWENNFHFPDYGITLAYFNLGSEEKLGKGFAVYPFVDFPLSKNRDGSLHFRYGMGLGYIEKTFNSESNIKNAGIGSHLNGVVHFDFHFEKSISKKSTLEIGTGITHYSNGSYSLPNLGINIATVNLALHHSFGINQKLRFNELVPVNKSAQIHIYTGGFLKKVYPPEGNNFFAATLSAMRFKAVSLKSAWGAGADLFYDNSISFRIKRLGEQKTNSLDDFRIGIYGAYHLSVNKLGLMFNMGYYLLNHWKDDGNMYHRICLRYYFEKIFLCANLKSHYARADFVEAGVGVRM